MKYAIGIDVGGTNSRVALIDEDFNILERVQFPTHTEDPEATLQELADTIKSFDKPVVGIGMSCPGPLDLINGCVISAPNLGVKWRGYDLTETLSKMTGVPVWLENDANLTTLAEAVLGEGKDYRYVNFLTVSTGLGSGQVIDKKIFGGAHGFAHEVANAIVWREGPQHGTLKPGALEAVCSGTAITKRAQAAGLEVRHAGEVNDLAKAGNEKAQVIMEDAKEYLANFIASLLAVNDPEIVILGGSVATKIDGFCEDIEERVREKVYDPVKPYVKVHKSSLSEDSGLLGAACLAFERSGNLKTTD